VTVYVIDSGVTPGPEFENRLQNGTSFNPYGTTTTDCLGHGTHVTSLLGSKTYGVAKGVKIVPVKVFNCDNTTPVSYVLQAMYWVIKQPKGIVNLSIGGTYNTLMNGGVKDLTDAGFIVVVAAGNDGNDACNHSPSSEASAIVAGCSTMNNQVCSYSNEGTCVTLFAPGDNILGLSYIPGKTTYKSGTSMSSPHVAGVAATLYEKYPGILQKDMKFLLTGMAANNTLSSFKISSSPDLELRGFMDNTPPLPKCSLIKKANVCTNTPLCINVPKYGCRIYNFCGFKTKKQCLIRKRCKFTQGKCKLKSA
jgi:subtilisin family serine protease